jgi:hypothetical protein
MPENASAPSTKLRRLTKKQYVWLIGLSVALIAAAGITFWLLRRSSFFPVKLADSVSFDLYYPDQKKLPDGYVADGSKASTNGQVVIYSVKYDNKAIVLTIQKKPSMSDIENFYSKQLPIRNTITTRIGTATISSLNSQKFASVLTNGDSWIIITAPEDIDSQAFQQVVQSLR